MLLSVFTPCYNRAYTLTRLFESIKAQKFSDFEWIIVDDGSSDNTKDLIESWIVDDDLPFEIRYFYQENAGKHVAWNNGLSHARGELFLPVDSDDYFVDGAFESVLKMWKASKDNDQLIAFSGVGVFPGNKETGGFLLTMDEPYKDYSSITRRAEGIDGDLAEIFFTSKLRKYPFPVFEGERFVTEAVVFNRFSKDGYLIRGFAYPIYACEYLNDGYTKNVNHHLISNWKGYKLYIRELMGSNAPISSKFIPFCGFVYRFFLKIFRIVK